MNGNLNAVNDNLGSVNGNLGLVNGNLGPVNGNLGAFKNQQFAVTIGILLFLAKKKITAICCVFIFSV